MSSLAKHLTLFLEEKEINALICDLALQLDKDYASKDIAVIAPLKGSLIFASDLVRQMQRQLVIDFVQLTKTPDMGIKITQDIGIPITGKDVLIVQEIIDIGNTLQFLKAKIQTAKPNSIKIVTLLDKPSRREAPLFPDYVGKTIEDRFLVGYGLDFEGLGRNFKNIYQLKQ